MFSRRLKTGYFVVEGLNSFGVVYYFYYFYFFMQRTFGFDNKANLTLAALNGAVYALGSWWAGRFAQRFGYFTALKVGLFVMLASLGAGSQLTTAPAHIAVMLVTVVGMCFTWPALEALVSEGEPAAAGLQQMIGVYNIVWASTAAAANFTGGAMFEHLGARSLFYVPICIQVTQLLLILWLEKQAHRRMAVAPSCNPSARTPGEPETGVQCRTGGAPTLVGLHHPQPQNATPRDQAQPKPTEVSAPFPRAKSFLRMAWLANPCAYIAINTLIAVIPGLARRLELSAMLAGFCCSVWLFARLAAFVVLWQWTGWHYRFRWLLAAYTALIATFAAILLVPDLTALVLAQVVFGGAVGLIYYSSLFYSMDSSETKGEHGGIHEAAIGLGNFAGPAVGAAALQFLPQYTGSGALAVSLVLVGGLGGLTAIWRRGRVVA